MSDVQATPLTAIQAGAVGGAAAPEKPLTAIQIIEQEIGNFIQRREQGVTAVQKLEQQREQALANVHALEGAIQAANLLLTRLKGEEQKAVAMAQEAAEKAASVAGEVAQGAVKEADKVLELVKERV